MIKVEEIKTNLDNIFGKGTGERVIGEVGEVSDGYHTFNDLYHHRTLLFATICNSNRKKAWKSRKHVDGTEAPGFFVAGVKTPQGMFTYHCETKYWDIFEVKEIPRADYHDGHTEKDVTRLLSLPKKKRFFQRFRCEHEYKTVTNIYGDPINHCGGYRSIRECIHCGKRIYSKKLDPDCHISNKF